jgi:hypothetical protein
MPLTKPPHSQQFDASKQVIARYLDDQMIRSARRHEARFEDLPGLNGGAMLRVQRGCRVNLPPAIRDHDHIAPTQASPDRADAQR